LKEGKKREVFEWLKALAIAVIIAVIIRGFIFTNYVVEGKSMMPTLQDGNRLIVNKIDYDFTKPHRFDIVIFHATPTDDYVKRVIGLPGDTLEYKNDVLYINGNKIAEPYLQPYKSQLTSGFLTRNFTLKEVTGETHVPPGKIFVMGDNRQNSVDSRRFGFVDISQIVGKVDLRYWPFSEIDLLR
jgi:signal peptidase I